MRAGGGETYLHVVFAHGGGGVRVVMIRIGSSDGLWGLVERAMVVASECSCDGVNDGGREDVFIFHGN